MAEPVADKTSIPIVEEKAIVSKRVEETGRVRVSTSVRHHQVHLDEPLRIEEVVVERVPVGQWVDGPQPPRDEGETTIFPVVEEVPVVTKRYRLIEEVRISKRVRTEAFEQDVELAHTEVSVDRIPIQANERKEVR
jgi:uncharacterized protein (TIGR02271 family)